MSFLQPWFLLALPVVALPIVIHLLNQRRHQTVPWAASIFVREVSRESRGNAVIRQWLVLLLRMMALATLLLVASRPLATTLSGFGMLGASREQLVLVDRSPSMELTDVSTGLTCRENLLGQLDQLLEKTGTRSRCQLIEPHRLTPIQASNEGLISLPSTEAASVTTDVPVLIEAALNTVERDQLGPTDVWVCSDLQAADWKIDSGRWSRIRKRLAELDGTRLRILQPASTNAFNVAVSVKNIAVREAGGKHYLELDLIVQQTSGEITAKTVPVVIRVAGIERRIEAKLVAGRFDAKRLRVDLPEKELQGGGVIELPTDANENDNTYFFAYAPAAPRRTTIVSDDKDVRELLGLVCITNPDGGDSYACDLFPASRIGDVNWSETSLLVWHAPLPIGAVADRLREFVASGRSVLFLPNAKIDSAAELFGVRWGGLEYASLSTEGSAADAEQTATDSVGFAAQNWRRDGDLLATDEDGKKLPVNRIRCRERRAIESQNAVTLASFVDGQPLLLRAATRNGGAYFLTSLPTAKNSNFVDDGVVLFVMMHRLLDAGAAASGKANQVVAGQLTENETRDWKPLDMISTSVMPSERPFSSGVYASGDEVFAVNRAGDEDNPELLDRAALNEILGEGLFDLVLAANTENSSLASQVWKPFMVLVILTLLLEGWMSMPSNTGAQDLPVRTTSNGGSAVPVQAVPASKEPSSTTSAPARELQESV